MSIHTFDNLSVDAKAVLGSLFSMTDTLNFQLVKGRPTARMQAALDELVKAHAVECQPMPQRADGSRGVTYKRLIKDWRPFRKFVKEAGEFIITEDIPGA